MTDCCDDCRGSSSRRSFLATLGASSFAVALAGLPTRAANALPHQAVTVAKDLTIYPRSTWGVALPPKSGLKAEESVKFLLVHHTAASNTYRSSRVAQEIQSIYRFHTGTKKWPDVCYNFFVDRFGGVWEGRAGSLAGPVQADATGGSQGFAQLVCLLGNFETTTPPTVMVKSCAKVLGWLATKYNIDLDQAKTVNFVSRGSNKWKLGAKVKARPISGHRDMSATLCPGKYLYPKLDTEIPALAQAYKLQFMKP